MPYLKDLINNDKSNEWKIQINMHVNLISSKEEIHYFSVE